jgi:hypothetical protein
MFTSPNVNGSTGWMFSTFAVSLWLGPTPEIRVVLERQAVNGSNRVLRRGGSIIGGRERSAGARAGTP